MVTWCGQKFNLCLQNGNNPRVAVDMQAKKLDNEKSGDDRDGKSKHILMVKDTVRIQWQWLGPQAPFLHAD